jgi:hypothetical protein
VSVKPTMRWLCATAALLVSAVPGVTHSEGAGGAGSVAVTAAVRGVHLVVLDEAGEISQVWSNAPAADAELVFRAGALSGPELPASDALLQQYQTTAAVIDWSRARGLVWQRAAYRAPTSAG